MGSSGVDWEAVLSGEGAGVGSMEGFGAEATMSSSASCSLRWTSRRAATTARRSLGSRMPCETSDRMPSRSPASASASAWAWVKVPSATSKRRKALASSVARSGIAVMAPSSASVLTIAARGPAIRFLTSPPEMATTVALRATAATAVVLRATFVDFFMITPGFRSSGVRDDFCEPTRSERTRGSRHVWVV